MFNEAELNAIKGLMHYLNANSHAELCFDVSIIEANGSMVGIITTDGNEYQLRIGGS